MFKIWSKGLLGTKLDHSGNVSSKQC